MYLYLIRHGESEGNKLGRIQGWRNFPLSELGREQAKKVAEYFKSLPLDYIYSSDLTRAYETAKTIADTKHMTVEKLEQLREIALGPFEGKTKEEIYQQYPIAMERTLLTSGVEGTEQVEDITKRCSALWEKLQHDHQGNHVAFVTHGGLISIFIMYVMLGEEWYNYHRPFQIDNTSITLIEAKAGRKPLFHYINNRGHLQEWNSFNL